MGVWIETLSGWWWGWCLDVTPCMGVWIETRKKKLLKLLLRSHPVWVCGLKLLTNGFTLERVVSHPVWVCGLKLEGNNYDFDTLCHTLRGCVDWNTSDNDTVSYELKSHPSWVCGLKHCHGSDGNILSVSHPSWVCGLKLDVCCSTVDSCRHTLRGCVDWNITLII